ncbi:hypothetical protein ACFXAZ_34355 [Streptomyces sp. NPDC059477]|uniref:hypothetical protein n=1 Tax=Streptomyces sp. NPDC059477 TaxID=3346847 RepID=UPI0036B03F24
MPLHPFVIALEPDDHQALNRVVEKGLAAEAEWLAAARKRQGIHHLRGEAARAARGRVRTEFARLRKTGKLAGTRDLVVAREVRAELKRRGMTGAYEPVPVAQAGASGRPVGSSPRKQGRLGDDRTTLTSRLAVRLPADLGDQLVRACYWESAPAVKALLEWQDRWGDGPEVIMREAERNGALNVITMFVAALAPRPDADSLLEKVRLQDMVVTTGDIIRSAVKHAIH